MQGLTNGTLTAVIGFQTIRYLNKEYKLQNILDGVEVGESEEELAEECKKIESELRAVRAKGRVIQRAEQFLYNFYRDL